MKRLLLSSAHLLQESCNVIDQMSVLSAAGGDLLFLKLELVIG